MIRKLFKKCHLTNPSNAGNVVDGLHEEKVFQAFLEHERAVAVRFGLEMCVLALPLPDACRTETARKIGSSCAMRLRATDVAGWLDPKTVGIILPHTSHARAIRVAEKICRPTHGKAGTLAYRIYAYPNRQDLGEDLRVASQAGAPANIHPLEALSARPMPFWKRTFDVVLALFGILVSSPLLLVLGLGIKAVSPGPVLFRQERIGYCGRRFMLYKFRSMKVVAETRVHREHLDKLMKSDTRLTKLDGHDTRLIPFGRIFRASGLDELPQLFNILRGEMSFIGPRPCVPYEYAQFQHWHRGRCDVYPGLTGLWQVNGKNKTTFTEMMRFDNAYARRQTLRQDLQICWMTIPAVFGQIIETTRGRAAPSNHDPIKVPCPS